MYDYFVGDWGCSWWHRNEEFEAFNGPEAQGSVWAQRYQRPARVLRHRLFNESDGDFRFLVVKTPRQGDATRLFWGNIAQPQTT